MSAGFSDEQKLYLEGLGRGFAAARAGRPAEQAPPYLGPERAHRAAQDRQVAAGRKLTREEEAKRAKHPFDMWEEIGRNAAAATFPKGTDVFLYKFHGLFYVAPAQDCFMLRLRNPNGIIDAHKLRAVASIAERYGGDYAHVTTRANLQVREIGAGDTVAVLELLAEAGLTSRGSGADNIRNITGNPTAGVDPQELIDTRPLGLKLYHTILNHRDLYGLPRKFNIAFDGGGAVASLEDTNDIGFTAVRVAAGKGVPEGIYFRVAVAGITGHKDFAHDLGIVVAAEDCTPVALAILGVFIDEGDRCDRTRARLKYVVERLGLDTFRAKVEERLARPPARLPREQCEPRPAVDRGGHIGFHPQKQAGLFYCGVAVPVGRLTVAQMRGIADIAERHGSGTIRLTVWQNLILSDIPEQNRVAVAAELQAIGLSETASAIRAGLVACTGNSGCKFSASDTKGHAAQLLEHLEPRVALDGPINIHITGCPHSCAQHYVGDIGLLATKVPGDDDHDIEAYHLFAGGGYGEHAQLAREIARDVPAVEVPPLLERLLQAYMEQRESPAETFQSFAGRHSEEELRGMLRPVPVLEETLTSGA
jgi:ferredoxin-nitrite reductase